MLYESGAQPVLILNKKDICPDYEEHIEKVKEVYGKDYGKPFAEIAAICT